MRPTSVDVDVRAVDDGHRRDPRVRSQGGGVVGLGVDDGEVGDPAVPLRRLGEAVQAGGERRDGHDAGDPDDGDQRSRADGYAGAPAVAAQREGQPGHDRRRPAEPRQREQPRRARAPGAALGAHDPGRGRRREQQERERRDGGAQGHDRDVRQPARLRLERAAAAPAARTRPPSSAPAAASTAGDRARRAARVPSGPAPARRESARGPPPAPGRRRRRRGAGSGPGRPRAARRPRRSTRNTISPVTSVCRAARTAGSSSVVGKTACRTPNSRPVSSVRRPVLQPVQPAARRRRHRLPRRVEPQQHVLADQAALVLASQCRRTHHRADAVAHPVAGDPRRCRRPSGSARAVRLAEAGVELGDLQRGRAA